MTDSTWYLIGAWVVGIIAFLAIWIYSFASWGLLIGLMVGWIPALIGGFIAGLLWPLILLVVVVGGVLLYAPLFS